MRICLVYDCLFPWTVGGAERWLRGLAEALVADGHRVTYLTRLQWSPDEPPQIPGVDVVAVSRSEPLYGPDGNRTVGEPVRFGLGVARHLARHGRDYDVVHCASFPYFSLLATGALRRPGRYRIVTDWYEVWSPEYWRTYVGGPRGRVAEAIQRACARVHQHAFCFSDLHAQRLEAEGLKEPPTVLRGLWAGTASEPVDAATPPTVVFAGRMIAEKGAVDAVDAVVAARRLVPDLRAVLFGDGPQLPAVRAAIARHGAQDAITAPGFSDAEEVDRTLASAACLLLPSVREGYGLVVVEALAAGVPAVVVQAPDNAATELIENGVNGYVAASSAPDVLADRLQRVVADGPALRRTTADWFAAHATELSLQNSVQRVLEAYRTAR